ncbi:590_t:CDS:1 [Funneliformis geosporum]|nr:590_t:CDS:1 [Funneliformis geosporum]
MFVWRFIIYNSFHWFIAAILNVIDEAGLVHGHIRRGNILVENETADSTDSRIKDSGLHGPVDKPSQNIYGVIPFIVPEIFNGNTPKKESDIYSFGMIMWMLTAGARPYYDRAHNYQLVQDIYSGLRPSVVEGTPPVYSKLMLECLVANPSNMPTAYQLYEDFGDWVSTICDDPNTSELADQFDAAEEAKFANLEKSVSDNEFFDS